MEDVKIVVKSLLVTIVVIFVLQIRVGSNTIEASTHAWIQNSAITEMLRGVADGGIKVTLDFYHWLRSEAASIDSKQTSFWPFSTKETSASQSPRRRHSSARDDGSMTTVYREAGERERSLVKSAHPYRQGDSKGELPEEVSNGESAEVE